MVDDPVHKAPSAMQIEHFGTAAIPEADRSASLLDFIRVEWGGANSLATVVLGAFPIIFGLSFWQGVAAIVLGLVVGSLILAPMALFGPMSGTNNSVSSSAHFGIIGRIVGSFLSLLTAIAFFSISVWSSGDALIGTYQRLAGGEAQEWMFAMAYGLFAFAILAVCIFGFQLMVLISKIAVTGVTCLLLVGLFAFAPDFDPGFAGAQLSMADEAFIPLFVSSCLIVLGNPISFGAFLGDWSRYLPSKPPRLHLIGASFLAQMLTIIPFLFGLMTASIVAAKAPDFIAAANYTGGLIAITPQWFLLPLLVLALISGMSTGTTSLYGTGLDFSSVIPALNRVQATLLIGVASITLIFIGRFSSTLVASITTFVALIIVTTTPWMVVLIMGYIFRRGHYVPDAMQVFNRGQTGAPTGSTGAGTSLGCSPGFPPRSSPSPSSTCRGNLSAGLAIWPEASTSPCWWRW